MAARTRKPLHDEKTREKIQTSQLLNRLQDHILTHPKKKTFDKEHMTDSQVRAALGLLKKSLPDLALLAHSFDYDGEGKTLLTEALEYLSGKTTGIPDTDE